MIKTLNPICKSSFLKWLKTNQNYENIYNSIGNLKIFDVSLRDGIQSISPEAHSKYTTKSKLSIYDNIIKKYNPNYIEVGSLVSPKVLPILADSEEIFSKVSLLNNNKNYLLIPNSSKLRKSIELGCYNISLISSVSDSFQIKNTKKKYLSNKTRYCRNNV